MSKKLLASDVAKLANVSADTVVLWNKKGQLRAEKTVGGVRLFDMRDVEAFLAKRQTAKAKQ